MGIAGSIPATKLGHLFAGLYEVWQSRTGERRTTFTTIMTSANWLLEPIHNRMPVILGEASAADWMNPHEPDALSLNRLLVPAPNDRLVVGGGKNAGAATRAD
jgi:putative SOS response-associated peptidase YedK